MTVLPLLTLALVVPPILAYRCKQSSTVVLFILSASLLSVGLAGFASVLLEWRAGWIVIGLLPILCLASVLSPAKTGIEYLLSVLGSRGRLRGCAIGLLTFIVFLGATEWTIFLLVKTGVIELESPMRTRLGRNTADWREATIIADYTREPDPVLFWRSKPIPPYNSQRFQGPVVRCPKPSSVFRIMCYGDSNTDGHTGDGGWPALLNKTLATRRWNTGMQLEIVNAGVMGYSSHQGLMRFREEVEQYEPDLVFVSFGWNDAPEAIGKPDKGYELPADGIIYVQRVMLRFRFYRLLHTAIRPRTPASSPTVGPRVSVEDYKANLRAFQQLAQQHGAEIVLLTRPHRATVSELRTRKDWRRTLPDYNEGLMEVGVRDHVRLVDVRARFASSSHVFTDECHFNSEGHQLMAELLAQKLEGWFAN